MDGGLSFPYFVSRPPDSHWRFVHVKHTHPTQTAVRLHYAPRGTVLLQHRGKFATRNLSVLLTTLHWIFFVSSTELPVSFPVLSRMITSVKGGKCDGE